MTTPTIGDGERRLLEAIRRLRHATRAETRARVEDESERPGVSLEPTNTFEYHVITRLNQLEAELQAIKARHDWLIRLVLGGLLAGAIDILLK